MHPRLKKAADAAESILESLLSDEDSVKEANRIMKLSKKELITELLALKTKKSKAVTVEEMVYAIMCSPDCADLSYKMIAAIVTKHKPDKSKPTTDNNISWYASQAIEKDRDIVPRISTKEFNKLVLESMVA